MKRMLLMVLIILGYNQTKAQDLTFTFDNAQITNDGVDDYYDVDVMIQSTVDFKLGSGQIYLTYNTAAFGDNVSANSNLVYSQPAGSILGETYTFAAYKDFIQNDNTASRLSLAFQQGVGSGTIADNNVTSTPRMLLHVRIKFADVNEDPMIAFETGAVYLDQFYTACGPSSGVALADCAAESGIQLFNDSFDSSNSSDTTAPIITLTGDNPQEIEIGSGYTELGATTDDGASVIIDDSEFVDTIGTYTIYYDATDIVGNTAAQVTRTVNVVPVLSVTDNVLEGVALSPNPAQHYIQLSGLSEMTAITIYSINGKVVKDITTDPKREIDIKELTKGVYFVQLTSGGASKTVKLVKS